MPHGSMKSIAVDPDVHQRAKLAATAQGISLMEFTQRALEVAIPPALKRETENKKVK